MLKNPIPSTKDALGFDNFREDLAKQGRLPPSGAPKRETVEPVRSPSNRPNVLWLMTDQLRADALGFAGHPFVQTPNLDRLAARGTVFERSYCNSPVCGPSRASMMTGRYLKDHGVLQNNFRMHKQEQTLPEILAGHGYRTACVGKTHCGRSGIWEDNLNPADAFGATKPDASPFHPEHFPDAVYLHHRTSPNPNRMLYGTYPAPVEVTKSYRITSEAMKWLYYNDDPRPFILRLSFDDPHPPVVPPEPFFSMYAPEDIPDELVLDSAASLANKPAVLQEYNAFMGCGVLTEEDHRKHAAAYLGFVSHVDAQIGRFLDYFEQSEFADNTIILFNSDHGHYTGEHGFAGKGVGMHEGVSRIPTVIAWPGHLPEGEKKQVLIDGTDLLPTLLDLLELPLPESVKGKSLGPVLRQESDQHKDELFLQWSDFGFGLVGPKYKLTWYACDDDGELYDLSKDPYERDNLFHDPDYSDVKNEMLERLHSRR